MPTIVHMTFALEIDDHIDPCEWDWMRLMQSLPGLHGFGLVALQKTPYTSLADDPGLHTQH